MKFLYKTLLGIGILLTTGSLLAFSDISPEDPNAYIFQHLSDVGIMRGFEDGGFHPEKIVSRAEALTISLRTGGIAIPASFDPSALFFSDVNPNDWYAPAIARAIALDLVGQAETFRPNQPVSKAEFLAFLFRATNVNYGSFVNSKKGIAYDIAEDDWFALAFAYAKKYQIAQLPIDNLYHPYKSLSRLEVALMTFRQLRIFHGDAATRDFLELQAKIQQFMSFLQSGQDEQAQIFLPRILELTDALTMKQNNEDAVAAQALSRSLKHLIKSIRAFKAERELAGLEELFLASRYAGRTAEKSEKLLPFARDVQEIITDTLKSKPL